jgi:hypothetical protein
MRIARYLADTNGSNGASGLTESNGHGPAGSVESEPISEAAEPGSAEPDPHAD